MTSNSDKSSDCWNITKTNDYYLIKLSGTLTNEALVLFEVALQEMYKSNIFLNVVVNCTDLGDLPSNWVKSLIQFYKAIKSVNKQIIFIHLAPAIISYLREQGVDKSFPYKKTLREALVELGLVTKKAIDVDFINPFLSATMHVLQVQASTPSKSGTIKMKEDKTKHLGDISGVIGLVSDSFNGSVVISFPEITFLKIMSRMLGEEFTVMNKDLQDGAAELTNMIFGQAKVTLNEKGYGIKTAIPSVVSGKDHSVQSLSDGPQVMIAFQTDVGDFFIEICTTG